MDSSTVVAPIAFHPLSDTLHCLRHLENLLCALRAHGPYCADIAVDFTITQYVKKGIFNNRGEKVEYCSFAKLCQGLGEHLSRAFMPTLALTTDTKYDAIRLSKGDLRAIISQDENKAAWHEPNRPADNLYRSVSIKCNEAWEGLSINSLYNQRVALIPAKTNWNLGSDTEMTIQLKEKNAITREDEGEPLSTAKYLQDYADTYERLTKALCEESTNIRSKNLKLIHENDHLDKETKKLETKKRKLEEDKLAKDVAESERLQRERQELEAQKSIRWKEDRRLKKLSLRLKNEQKMLDKQWNEFQDKKEIFEEEKQQFEEGKLKLQKELHSLFPREIEEGN